ncbi:uncharacterized protein C20orf96 homolog isoform X2 [Phasianus colchicus]|uniref:Uncharacterized protein n=1 Tax=Phasianus colchicus TaxID=9054 RepID=A0A669P0R1_PHACC|nr:uncharacterized protein C20orf96 homolog isoform X2 [Phasianus colchicus]
MDAKGPSAVLELKGRVGSTWQKATAERKLPAHELALPPIADGGKKKGQKNKSAVFVSRKTTPLVLKASSQEKYRAFTEKKAVLKEAELAGMLEEMKMTVHLTKLKTKAIEELKQCSDHLAKTNCWLMKDIQHTDDSTAKQARDLLHQYEVYQMIEAMTQTISQNQLDMARAELQEMEKTMEKNLGKLQQQLDEVTSKVQVLQDELSILRTFTDLNQAMQIVLLLSNIQNLKKQQQDEIDETEKMGKAILEELEEKSQLEQEEILQKVAEEVLLHQDGLKQMVINNHILRHEIRRQKEIIKDLEEEISELKRSVQTLRQSARDPREMIFADVFLHRPKCTPDTEVVLHIPTEENPLPWCPQRSDEMLTNTALPSPAALLPPGPTQPL